MAANYHTILEDYETEVVIKKSRFISRIYHVESEEDIDSILTFVKKEHYKATHVCSAWVLNTLPLRQKANDDGEPSGTAGKPILEVIHHHHLTNVLVIVIRYFGGIKLGAGGLIRAYASGATQVINKAQIILKQYSHYLCISIDYNQYGSLKNLLTEKNILPISEEFGEDVTLDFYLPVEESQSFVHMIREHTNDRFSYEILGEEFIDIKVN